MSVLPALGSAQATILAQSFTKEKDHESFLVIVGGISNIKIITTNTRIISIKGISTPNTSILEPLL